MLILWRSCILTLLYNENNVPSFFVIKNQFTAALSGNPVVISNVCYIKLIKRLKPIQN